MTRITLAAAAVLAAAGLIPIPAAAQKVSPGWHHLSAKKGDLPLPNTGTQQTSATVFDVDKDGRNDFVITERRAEDAVTWFRRTAKGWDRYVLDAEAIRPEAGATSGDVDGDGDTDYIAGSDGSGNWVYWWENPYPTYDPAKPWRRHTIKSSDPRKHHDLMWVDVDGDGRNELVIWNQAGRRLLLARPPANPKGTAEWPMKEIYLYSGDSEMQQRGIPPAFKTVNEHEGLAFVDINLDGRPDIVGGGLWFQHMGGDRFLPHPVDESYHFSRSGAGQFIEGGRPEIVLVVGDGEGPLNLYEWVKGTWKAKTVIESIDNGHSLLILDFNKDGHLDIFCAEMRLNSGNPDSKIYILLGDGKGNFSTAVVAEGFDNHESKVADLDGDGELDVLSKPYNHGTPDLNIFLNRLKR